ncbi:hypothetical protein GCM10028895_10190 [Pontibacter rugosus]
MYLTGVNAYNAKNLLLAWGIDKDGILLWEQVIDTGSPDIGILVDATIDQQENLILAGIRRFNKASSDYLVVKISPSGEQLWQQTYDAPGNSMDWPRAVAVDSKGQIAVTGFSRLDAVRLNFYDDVLTVLFSANGSILGAEFYGQGDTVNDYSHALAFDKYDNLYFSGYSSLRGSETNFRSNLFTLKYKTAPTCNVPVAVKLYLPPTPVKLGDQLRTTALLGDYAMQRDEGVKWTWGDGSSSMSYTAFGTNRITGQHTYAEAGIYKIGLNFSETCLKPTSDDYMQWKAVYDPAAGTVSGAGWIGDAVRPVSLAQLQTNSLFTFSVRYRNAKATTPTGITLLTMPDKSLFYSSTIHWLVIKANRAVWEGEGTLNGKGKYKFVASAHDGGGRGQNDNSDNLRIKVWDMQSGAVVYDSYAMGGEIYDMAQLYPSIGGGQIIINSRPRPAVRAASERALTALSSSEDMQAHPNPFTTKATVKFTLAQEGKYSLLLYDMKGALLGEVKQGQAASGETVSVEIDGTALAKGMYFVKLQANGEVRTLKLVVVK